MIEIQSSANTTPLLSDSTPLANKDNLRSLLISLYYPQYNCEMPSALQESTIKLVECIDQVENVVQKKGGWRQHTATEFKDNYLEYLMPLKKPARYEYYVISANEQKLQNWWNISLHLGIDKDRKSRNERLANEFISKY